MAEQVMVVNDIALKYRDVFHMKGLYQMIRFWLLYEDFVREDYDQPSSEKYMEKLMLERREKGGHKEMWIWWRTFKDETKFFRLELDVDYHVLFMKDIEIMHEGVKLKTQQGEVEIKLTARVVMDPEGDWEKNKILKAFNLHNFVKKRLLKKELEGYKLKLYRKTYELHRRIKQYLDMKGFLEETEAFWPQHGH
ncbi:hypothetical protein JW968_03175 [Candidatus Woesearchaeota archaeon]|nr:hypothetical protein [Candidatus Woesearchaeota archaeon]